MAEWRSSCVNEILTRAIHCLIRAFTFLGLLMCIGEFNFVLSKIYVHDVLAGELGVRRLDRKRACHRQTSVTSPLSASIRFSGCESCLQIPRLRWLVAPQIICSRAYHGSLVSVFVHLKLDLTRLHQFSE